MIKNGFYWLRIKETGQLTIVQVTDGWVDFIGSLNTESVHDLKSEKVFEIVGPVSPLET